ncbi:MAG: class I poly(R)-hydroxyalkanoic acid synthase, partial [Sphingomonadales bacterium]
MAETPTPTPSLEDLQHWTWVLGKAQQMMLEQGMDAMQNVPGIASFAPAFSHAFAPMLDPSAAMRATANFWADTMQLWQRFLDPAHAQPFEETADQARDKRFKAPQWREEPVFDFLRQSYFMIADHMLKGVDTLEGVDPKQKEQIRFATKGFIDAVSPSNFPATNPQVLEKIVETKGESLLKGLQHMMADMQKGQMTQTTEGAFELGRNLAMTPGKVVKRTDLYELIQYSPTTKSVYKTPLIIFPPWINR